MSAEPKIRFGVIGIDHPHIYGQSNLLLRAGAELVSFYATEPALITQFAETYPQARLVSNAEEILEDESIHLIASAAIPDERAPLGIRAMKHGKDYMSDKPGFVSLEQLEEVRRVQSETGCIYSIDYSERLEVPAAVKAGELVHAGVIGKVVQTLGLGPHRTRIPTRPEWFFHPERYGGIITDIGSHQVDQFLFYTGSTEAEVAASQVGNFKYPEYPEFQDFGDLTLRGNGGTGYIRLDWYTPDGLDAWGDGRLFILGTEGYIELRKNTDIAGRPGSNHLFLVDQRGIQYMDCQAVQLPYGSQLIYDVIHRTETAMSQAHCFLASELALKAQVQAAKLGHLENKH